MINKEHKVELRQRIEDSKSVDELVKLVEEVERSYGNCQACYGKGYSTQRTGGTTALGDFIGDPDVHIPERTEIVFCDCSRGEGLKRVLGVRNG